MHVSISATRVLALGLLVAKSHNLEISEWQGVGMFPLKLSSDEGVQS